MRIISLLPSATEIVAALGLVDQLVGVTHECDFPEQVRSLPKVTRTLIPADATSGEIDRFVRERLETEKALYTLDAALVAELRPDLIITQSLCEVCAVAPSEVQAAIAGLPNRPQVIDLEPLTLEDVFQAMLQVGQATCAEADAERAVATLRDRVAIVKQRGAQLPSRPRSLILEWIDPLFCAGHWNPELVQLAGGEEMIGQSGQPSRSITWEEVAATDPECLLIACCGYTIEQAMTDLPKLQAKPKWQHLACVRNRRVFVADGSAYFNRPGPRLVDSLEILAQAIAGEVPRLPSGVAAAVRV